MLVTAVAIGLAVHGAGFQASSVTEVRGTGPHVRKVSTRIPEAQRQFNRGLNLLYAFHHEEATRAFQAAAKADPGCAMAYWGIAAANGPHVNNPSVSPEQNRLAIDALKVARTKLTSASSAEKMMVAAMSARFAEPAPADRSRLDRAYAQSMRKAWQIFPRDADIGALFAESLMDIWPWNYWRPDGSPQPDTATIVGTLERVIKLEPRHPLALHLYIHVMEASPHPGRAVAAANRLRFLQPGLGHNVHMPSHIDIRIGDWQAAIEANVRAMAADSAFRRLRRRIGFYRLYMAHNYHMLAFAAMMSGQSARAIRTIDAMVAAVPGEAKRDMAPILDGFMSMPIEVRKRFGKWDAVLAAPEPEEQFPIARALRHASRAVAFAAKGKVDEAQMERALFSLARAKVPKDAFFGNNSAAGILDVAQNLMEGEVLIAEGDGEAALKALRQAVRAEDRLRYDEPPDWILPSRHTLGAYLMNLGRHSEAVSVYREDLRKWPENGWALYGLSECLKVLGKIKESKQVRARFEKTWARSDMPITSSCLCLPGK